MALVDTDPVSSWIDRISGYNVRQTAITMPIYRTGIANGEDVVRFASAGFLNDIFDHILVGLTGKTGLCIFVVINDAVSSGFGSIISRDGPSDRGFNLLEDTSSNFIHHQIPESASVNVRNI